jgi:hypothetical protein
VLGSHLVCLLLSLPTLLVLPCLFVSLCLVATQSTPSPYVPCFMPSLVGEHL